MKKKIKENIVTWDSYELSGKLPTMIEKLQTLITDNPNCFDFEIDVESESGYYGSCYTNISIDAYRWETDEEMAERIRAAKKASAMAEINKKHQAEANAKRERSLYESLKRKFEKEIEEGSKP